MKKRIALSLLVVIALLSACSTKTPTLSGPDLSATLLVISPMPVTATSQGSGAQPTPAVVTAAPPTAAAATSTPQATQQPAATATSAPTQSPTAAPSAGATRLEFAAGATSADVSLFMAGGTSQKYVLKAIKGQVMMLTTTSANNNVFLDVTGVETGKKLLSLDKQWTMWQGALPTTQDYLVQLYAGGGNTQAALHVVIPQRISFEAGGTSATVSGTVQKDKAVTYLVGAAKGQKMTVTVTSASQAVALTIYGLADGEPLVRAATGAKTWTGTLPGTQDYVVEAVSNGAASSYSLKVEIP